MATLIALPVEARVPEKLVSGIVWLSGRYRFSEAGQKVEERAEIELPPTARKLIKESNRVFGTSKFGPNDTDEVIFEIIKAPSAIDALDSVLLIWLNDSSIFSANEFHEISQLQKKGRDLLNKINVNVDQIPKFSRALVVTTDETIEIRKSYGIYKFEDKEFLLRHRFADVIALSVFQESSTFLLEKLASAGFGYYRKGSRFLRALDYIDSQIWWNHLSNSKPIKKFLLQLRENTGLMERHTQLKEIGKGLSEKKSLREHRLTNLLVIALAAISIWASLSK